MNYEERYNELIDAIKEMMEANPHDEGLQNWVHDNVPELTESEDERIRKEIIDSIKELKIIGTTSYREKAIAWLEKLKVFAEHGDGLYYFGNNGFTYVGNPTCDNVSWIEKQGDKPQGKTAIEAIKEEKVDNRNCATVEPKFQNGQWVVWQNKCYKVNYNGCGYELVDQNGLSTSLEYGTIDENARLWTIEDAKDGDVLAAHECYVIFKEIDGLNIKCYCTYHYMNNPSFYVDTLQNKNTFHPATKEQRDTLMKAMTDAGYTFDFETRELSKIKQNSTDNVKPKFKIGDWIIHQGTENIYQVVAVIDNQYQLRYGDNYTIQKCDEVDRNARLWNISDAKGGDLLYIKYNKYEYKYEWIIIFKHLNPEEHIMDYCSYCINGTFYSDSNPWGKLSETDTVYPATKEQCDLLFSKIKENGYWWNAKNKILKKIES